MLNLAVSRRPSLLVTLPLFLLLAFATAQVELDSPERQELQGELARYQRLLAERAAELGQIEASLGETAATLRERISERDRVSNELAERRREREDLLAQIGALQGERAATEERVAELEVRLEGLKERTQNLLVSLYKQRGRRSVAGLAATTTFHELRVRNHYLGLLAEQDADVIVELDGVLTELSAERERLVLQLAEVQAAEEELAITEQALASSEERLSTVISELNATQAGQMAQQAALIEEQNQIESSIGTVSSQLEQEIARLHEEERKARQAAESFAQDRAKQLELQREADEARARAEALSSPLVRAETGYILPFDEATLVSKYGERNNSYLGIRAPVANSAVRTVQTGRVAAITYLGANLGYMVAVQHGDGLMTIYVNLRQPLVELGDNVTQGDILGYLGGGTLTRSDVLQLYAQRTSAAGNTFVDPAPLLGW